jgi:two-component system NtrC family sensor kinase
MVARSAAIAAAVMPALALLGWTIDVKLLRTALPGQSAMNPFTAFGLLGASASLALLATSTSAGWRRFGQACALVVLMMGALKLASYGFGRDLSFDRWLFCSRLGSSRMSANGAFSFALVGLALLTLDRRTRGDFGVAQLLILAPACVSLLALSGYAYNVLSFYRVSDYSPMAFNTALAFAILCVGVFCARPQYEPLATLASDTPSGVVERRLLAAAVAVPFVFGWIRLLGEWAGFYRGEFGVSLLVVASTFTMAGLIWWNGRSLYHMDLSRRRTEVALRASEERARAIIDTAYDAFVAMNGEGVITAWNPQAELIFGWPFAEAIGRELAEIIIPPRYRDAHRQGLRHFLATGEGPVLNRRIEINGLRRDGTEFPVELTISVVAGAETYLFAAFVRDIGERRQAEERLHEQNRLLEAAVRSEREAHETLKRAQSALVQTEKLASLGQMVAGVAHEINNPLAFISSNLAVLQRDAAALRELVDLYRQAEATLATADPALLARLQDAGERIDVDYTMQHLGHLLERSREGVRRIAKIVKDMRGFARLDESERDDVDLNPAVESTVNIVQGHAARKGVRISTELAPLPFVACNPAKINQVVMNLLTNAIDACAGGGEVTVRTVADERGVAIEVTDTGPGIDPAIRDRIFDPFFTTKPIGEGTGLGLSISYGIAREHGGAIDVDSTPGKGARFALRLPRRT